MFPTESTLFILCTRTPQARPVYSAFAAVLSHGTVCLTEANDTKLHKYRKRHVQDVHEEQEHAQLFGELPGCVV